MFVLEVAGADLGDCAANVRELSTRNVEIHHHLVCTLELAGVGPRWQRRWLDLREVTRLLGYALCCTHHRGIASERERARESERPRGSPSLSAAAGPARDKAQKRRRACDAGLKP